MRYSLRQLALGAAFGVLKLTTTDGAHLDIALPRRESKAGRGHNGFLVEPDVSSLAVAETLNAGSYAT